MEEYRESLNPRTKQWRGSLRSWELSYEERMHRNNIERAKIATPKQENIQEEKSVKQNKINKTSKKKKSVRWSKKK